MNSSNPVLGKAFNQSNRRGYASMNTIPQSTEVDNLEETYNAPAASSLRTGRMTMDDVVARTPQANPYRCRGICPLPKIATKVAFWGAKIITYNFGPCRQLELRFISGFSLTHFATIVGKTWAIIHA